LQAVFRYAQYRNDGDIQALLGAAEFNPIELIFNKVKTEYKKLDHKNIKDEIT
jgi:hypothetical protein